MRGSAPGDEDNTAPALDGSANATRAAPLFDIPRLHDGDKERLRERERQMALALASAELAGEAAKPRIDVRAEMKVMANTKGGGAYVPPHRMRALMEGAEEEDKAGADYQRLVWEALRKSINGLVNKVNTSNIKMLVPEVSTYLPRLLWYDAELQQLTLTSPFFPPVVCGKPHSRTRTVCAVSDEGASILAAIHAYLCVAGRHRQHQAASSGRTAARSIDFSV